MNSTKQGSGAGRVFGRTPLVVLTAAAVFGIAACSSSGGTSGSSSSSSSSAASSSSSSAADTSASSSGASSSSKFFPGTKATGTPIKLGLVSDEGGGAESNSNYSDAAEAAAKYANDELGGIGGHVIEVDRCGTKTTAAGATACANQFVQDKVDAVVSASSGFGGTIVPIVVGAGIPYVGASGNATEEVTTDGSFMWSGGFAATLNGFASYAKEQGWKKITVFPVDVPAAAGAVTALGGPFFRAAGVTVKVTPIPGGIADATPQVTAGVSDKPDAVAIVNNETGCTTTLKAIQVVDPTIPTMVNSSCLNSGTAQALGSAFNGVKVMANFATDTNDAEAQLYAKIMSKYAPKADPTGFTGSGYQSMLGLIRAVAAGGITSDVTPASIKAAIKAAKNVPLPLGAGKLTFTCDGTAVKGLISDCSLSSLVLTVTGGKGLDPQVVK